jgi:hypothetical protein
MAVDSVFPVGIGIADFVTLIDGFDVVDVSGSAIFLDRGAIARCRCDEMPIILSEMCCSLI